MATIDQKKVLEKWKRGLNLGKKGLSLYKQYGFRERPFKRDLIDKNSYLFVPPQEFYELPEWVASCYAANQSGLLIGASDVGKSTLARFLAYTLSNSVKDAQIHYVQLKGLADASEKNPKPEEVFIDGPHAIGIEAELQKKDLAEPDILIVDDIEIGLRREKFIDELDRYIQTANHTIIGITTPSVPSEIIDLFGDVYRINSIEHETIVKILTTRIYYYKENGEEKDSTRDLTPFTEEALNRITEYSIGLPGLALDLADSCLQGITDFNETEITPEIVDYIAQILQYPIAKDIEMGRSINYVEEEGGERKQKELNLSITGSKASILKEILFQSRLYPEKPGITNTKLSNSTRISIQAHTISYHTNILEKCKILEVQEGLRSKKKGKFRYFYLRKPIMNAIELRFLPQKPPATSEVMIKR